MMTSHVLTHQQNEEMPIIITESVCLVDVGGSNHNNENSEYPTKSTLYVVQPILTFTKQA